MEKRILIAFLLSFGVLYAFRFMFPPPAVDKTPEDTKTVTPSLPVSPAPPPPTSPTPASIPGESVQADAAEEKSVDTAVYRAVVSNVGAVLKSFQLKKYLDADGKPLELIDAYAAAQAGFPFAIATADPTLDKLLSEARFVLLGDGLKLSLEYRGQGIRARKTFDFDPERYLLTVSTDLQRNGVAVPHEIVLQGEFGDQANPDVPAKRHAVYEAGEKFHRLVVTGIKEPQDLTGTLTGVEDQYFLAMFLRDKVGPLKVKKQDYKLPDLADGTQGAVTSGLYLSIPSTEPTKVYIGPKLEQSLVQADPRLDKAIDYGWFLFAVIAKPLLIALRWLDGFIGNYGWSIIVLTVLLNMILFPLRVKQQLGMQKMQKNMPHLKQLQEKYKKLKPGDPKRAEVEKELMEINKQQLSGCLPMLLQFPLLLAFFNMITAATELRGAPWILWIKDLSQPDHLYILPILMGVAMFVQMKMSPTSPDPAQAKMMLITPVLVTILFLWYQSASGLTLYWLTGNVIGIVQQWFIRKYWSDDDKPRAQHRQPSPA